MEITRLVTGGNRDPLGPPDHENNVWIVGDDAEVVVIDPAHDADAVLRAVGGRRVAAVLLTHGHWDHVRAAPRFVELTGVAPYLAPEDDFLWREFNGDAPYLPLEDGAEFTVAGWSLVALRTPGHTPGSTCFWLESTPARLFPLGDEVVINTGHGPSTTIGAERPQLQTWLDRGW